MQGQWCPATGNWRQGALQHQHYPAPHCKRLLVHLHALCVLWVCNYNVDLVQCLDLACVRTEAVNRQLAKRLNPMATSPFVQSIKFSWIEDRPWRVVGCGMVSIHIVLERVVRGAPRLFVDRLASSAEATATWETISLAESSSWSHSSIVFLCRLKAVSSAVVMVILPAASTSTF